MGRDEKAMGDRAERQGDIRCGRRFAPAGIHGHPSEGREVDLDPAVIDIIDGTFVPSNHNAGFIPGRQSRGPGQGEE